MSRHEVHLIYKLILFTKLMKIKLKGGKMKRKYILGIVALTMIAVLGVSMVSAFGWMNGFTGSAEDKAEMQEQMQAMQDAIENEDYDTWEALMEERIAKMQEQITEENFNEIVERYQEMKEKKEEMKESREEFCEEHDCPNFEEGEMNFRGLGHFRFNRDCPSTESDSE